MSGSHGPPSLLLPSQMALLPEKKSVPSAGAEENNGHGPGEEQTLLKVSLPLAPAWQVLWLEAGRGDGWWGDFNWLPCVCWHQKCPQLPQTPHMPSHPKKAVSPEVPSRHIRSRDQGWKDQ